MIELRELTKRYGNDPRRRPPVPVGRSRRDLRLPRPERRRQDDHDPHDDGAAAADGGRGACSAATTCTREPLRAKQLCGFVPDRPHVYEKLTGAEFLDFVAGLYHVDAGASRRARREHLLELFDLERVARRAGRELLARHEAAPGDGGGADPRAAHADRRRADGRAWTRAARGCSSASSATSPPTASRCSCRRTASRSPRRPAIASASSMRGRLIALGTVDELRDQAGRARRLDAGERSSCT